MTATLLLDSLLHAEQDQELKDLEMLRRDAPEAPSMPGAPYLEQSALQGARPKNGSREGPEEGAVARLPGVTGSSCPLLPTTPSHHTQH